MKSIIETGKLNANLLIILLCFVFSTVSAQRMVHVAGGPGDGKPALQADVFANSIAVGPDGAVYVSRGDVFGGVRRIDPTTGIIELFAGGYSSTYNALQGIATKMYFHPVNIAVSPDGKVYMADGSTIRFVNEAGELVTASGFPVYYQGSFDENIPATSAKFNGIFDLTFDSNGNLYIIDSSYKIRKIDAVTGLINTIAGNGTFGSTGNGGLAINASVTAAKVAIDNNIMYISETFFNKIRKVDLQTNIITDFAGTGNGTGPLGDTGPALSATLIPGSMIVRSGALYVADAETRVRKINLTTNVITAFAGSTVGFSGDGSAATSATLDGIADIAFDNSGNLLIVDSNNRRIRKVTRTTISTAYGNGGSTGDGTAVSNASFAGVFMARTSNGDLYITDGATNHIRKITKATGIISTVIGNSGRGYTDNVIAATALMNSPGAIAVDPAGNISFVDAGNRRIRSIDLITNVITTIAGNGISSLPTEGALATGTPIGFPSSISYMPNGDVLIGYYAQVWRVDHTDNKIYRFAGDGTGGSDGDGGSALNAKIGDVSAVLADETNVWIADGFSQKIRKVAGGIINTVAGTATPAPIFDGDPLHTYIGAPYSLAFGNNNEILIGTQPSIFSVDRTTNVMKKIAGTYLAGMDGDGKPALEANINEPRGMAADTDGTLWIMDGLLRKIVPASLTQTIIFNAFGDRLLSDSQITVPEVASATSSLALVLTSSDRSVAEIQGDKIILHKAGTVSIIATQPGNFNYLPAAPVERSLTVKKGVIDLSFTSNDSGLSGEDVVLTVNKGMSTGTVSFTVTNLTGSASVEGNVLHLQSTGNVSVTATLAPDNNYESATATQVVSIGLKLPVLKFTSLLTGNAGSAIDLEVDTGGSDGEVFFDVQKISGSASIEGTQLSLDAPGTVRVTASIGEDGTYGSTSITQILVIKSEDGTFVSETPKLISTTIRGGSSNGGVLYSTNPDLSNERVLYSFQNDVEGSTPGADRPIEHPNGKIYGTIQQGGEMGAGVIYSYDVTTNEYAVVHTFDHTNGASPSGSLALAPDGKLYGVTSGGGDDNAGVLYQFDPSNNSYVLKISFVSATGYYPFGGPVLYNGVLYGLTSSAGNFSAGTLYTYDLASQTLAVKVHFDASGGQQPNRELYVHTNGKMYGLTTQGGSENTGTIFEYDPVTSQIDYKVSLSVNNTGGFPYSTFALAPNGKLYALALIGPSQSASTVIEYTPGASYAIRKASLETDVVAGTVPTLALAPNGKFYGTASYSGAGSGALFEYTPGSSSVKVVTSFNSSTSYSPAGSLLVASNGKLYGTCSGGGPNGGGSFFEYDPATPGGIIIKKALGVGVDGLYPGNSIAAVGSTVYGTATGGLTNGGVLYSYNVASETYSKVMDFDELPGYGILGVAAHPNGKIYSATRSNKSAIVEYDPASSAIKYYHLNDANGNSISTMMIAKNRKIYGVGGIRNGYEAIFEFDPATSLFTTRQNFDDRFQGEHFEFTEASNGKLYAVESRGGGNGAGFIYSFDLATSNIEIVYEFTGNDDGRLPRGPLALAGTNTLIGVTTEGATNSFGALFTYNADTNAFAVIDALDAYSNGGVARIGESKFAVPVAKGGENKRGAIYEYSSGLVKKIDFDNANGSIPNPYFVSIKAEQDIAFPPLEKVLTDHAPIELNELASSGLAITYSSSNTSVATVSGHTITTIGPGETKITATQVGNDSYFAAQTIIRNFKVTKAPQTITFATLTDKTVGDAAFNLTGTASSNLPLTYSTTSDKITINAASVAIVKAGRVSIKGSQPGNAIFEAAETVERSFCIKPAKPVISVVNSVSLSSSNDNGNQWYLGGMPITGASTKAITAVADGTYSVKTTVDDCASELSALVNVTVMGLDDLSSLILLYPNPTTDELFVDLGNVNATIRLVDMLGRAMSTKTSNGGVVSFDVRDYSKGMYVVRVESTTVVTKPFVKR